MIELKNDFPELIYGTTSDIVLNNMIVYSALWTSDAVAPQTRCVAGLSPASVLDEAYWDLFGLSELGEISFTFAGSDGAWGEVTPSQEVSIAWREKKTPVDDSYDSLSVNGYMTGYLSGSMKIPAGKYGMVDVEIDDSSLQDNGIAGMTEISETEITLEIRDGKRYGGTYSDGEVLKHRK